jgi:hypothetical protein
MARLHEEPDDVGPAADPENGVPSEEGARRGHPKADGDDSARAGPRAEADDADVPPSEEDVLAALRRDDNNDSERADALRAAAIAQQVAERLRRDEGGLRIDTLALFNDSVSVGGGFSIGSPPATAPGTDAEGIRVVAEDELARHVDHYVHPPGFGAAFEIVRDRRLLILSAVPGTGREAAAYNLLVEVLTTGTEDDDGAVYVVTDSGMAARKGWTPGHRSSGYLLIVDEAGHTGRAGRAESAALTLGAIDGRWITETAAKLKDADSFMVVVADTPYEELLETLRRSRHVLPRLGTIEPLRIVERRVLARDAEPAELAALQARLDRSGALALLAERPQPAIAAHIAEVIREGADLAAAVRMLRDPTEQVRVWFGRHDDLPTICFVLSAAVLEGATYLTVSDAAVALYRELAFDPVRFPDLKFRDRAAAYLAWIDISVLTEHEDGPRAGPPRVWFRNPRVQQAVLGYAWTCFDGRRPAIQDWLRQLIAHPDVDVRARAAVAAGVVAWTDHDYALHRYLRSWAGSTSRVLRESAATALNVVGGHPQFADPMWRLLESWAEERPTPFQRRLSTTAAMAAGGTLGGREPLRALHVLRAALDREDWGTLIPVTWSLLHLLEQDRISEVLARLIDWSRPQDSSPIVTKALSAFAFLTRQPAPSRGDASGGPNGSPPGAGRAEPGERAPLLLAHAREHRASLEELWARALARKPAQTQALDALRECLDRYAGRDATVQRNIGDILLGVAARPGRHRARLEWHLEQWAKDRERPCAPAAEIHRDLVRGTGRLAPAEVARAGRDPEGSRRWTS